MLDDGPDHCDFGPSDQPANGDNRPLRPLDNRPSDPDPPATVAALDTSKILKTTTTTARDVPARAVPAPAVDQAAAAAADVEVACLAACGEGLSEGARIAIATTRPVIEGWLATGYDLTADILPTLAERTKHKRADPIRTWAYFTKAVAKRQALRIALAARPKDAGEPASTPKPTAHELMVMTADWINSGRYVPPSAVSTSKRAALLEAGLVTEATLRARQIY